MPIDLFTAVTGAAQLGSFACDASAGASKLKMFMSPEDMLEDTGKQITNILGLLERMENMVENYGKDEHIQVYKTLVQTARRHSSSLNSYTVKLREHHDKILNWFQLWLGIRRLHTAVLKEKEDVEGASRTLRAKILENKSNHLPGPVSSAEIDQAWIMWDQLSVREAVTTATVGIPPLNESESQSWNSSDTDTADSDEEEEDSKGRGVFTRMKNTNINSDSVGLDVLDYDYPPTTHARSGSFRH
ncbi:hypothetical protein GYMLUDRAFT_76430 [Collybiopsis luxurians FD-317 M1]|uniref:Uncharacterized protein n=1 Tax=Collybiopsis luxurians FD-317 M1 TaxID=944289 RepID=A0A0D0CKN3_9AGAR|nr:hypothetical protein GYMLUDRAFT_76430 [Collybiopsis luxurians FD-317 M1]